MEKINKLTGQEMEKVAGGTLTQDAASCYEIRYSFRELE